MTGAVSLPRDLPAIRAAIAGGVVPRLRAFAESPEMLAIRRSLPVSFIGLGVGLVAFMATQPGGTILQRFSASFGAAFGIMSALLVVVLAFDLARLAPRVAHGRRGDRRDRVRPLATLFEGDDVRVAREGRGFERAVPRDRRRARHRRRAQSRGATPRPRRRLRARRERRHRGRGGTARVRHLAHGGARRRDRTARRSRRQPDRARDHHARRDAAVDDRHSRARLARGRGVARLHQPAVAEHRGAPAQRAAAAHRHRLDVPLRLSGRRGRDVAARAPVAAQ
jgi:hypothetical protein